MGGSSTKDVCNPEVTSVEWRQTESNDWYNKYQYITDSRILNTQPNLNEFNDKNYHYLHQYVLPDETEALPNPKSLSETTGKVESVSYVKSQLLDNLYFKKLFDYNQKNIVSDSEQVIISNQQNNFDKIATSFLNTKVKEGENQKKYYKPNLKKIPTFPQELKEQQLFFNELPSRASVYIINILYKVWIIIQLVSKLSDDNFKHINFKVNDKGTKRIIIKNFKKLLIKKTCAKLFKLTKIQIEKNFLSTSNANFTENRSTYNTFATTHRMMTNSQAYKKFFIKNILSDDEQVVLPSLLFLKNEYKKWKITKLKRTKKFEFSQHEGNTWQQIPDYIISNQAYQYKAYIRYAEMKLFKTYFMEATKGGDGYGIPKWDAYRNILRKHNLPRAEWDPFQIHYLYTSHLTYWHSPSYYHNKEFYYGCSTRYYSTFSKLSHNKTFKIHQNPNIRKYDGRLNNSKKYINTFDDPQKLKSSIMDDLKLWMSRDLLNSALIHMTKAVNIDNIKRWNARISFGGKQKGGLVDFKGIAKWTNRQTRKLTDKLGLSKIPTIPVTSDEFYALVQEGIEKYYTQERYFIPVKFCPTYLYGEPELTYEDKKNFTDRDDPIVENKPERFNVPLVIIGHQLLSSKDAGTKHIDYGKITASDPDHREYQAKQNKIRERKTREIPIIIKGYIYSWPSSRDYINLQLKINKLPEDVETHEYGFTIGMPKSTKVGKVTTDNREYMLGLHLKNKKKKRHHNTFLPQEIHLLKKQNYRHDTKQYINFKTTLSQYARQMKEFKSKVYELFYFIDDFLKSREMLPTDTDTLSELETFIIDNSKIVKNLQFNRRIDLLDYSYISYIFIIERVKSNLTKLYRKYFGNTYIDKLLLELSFIEGKIEYLSFLQKYNMSINTNNQAIASNFLKNPQIVDITKYKPVAKHKDLTDVDYILMISKEYLKKNINVKYIELKKLREQMAEGAKVN